MLTSFIQLHALEDRVIRMGIRVTLLGIYNVPSQAELVDG